ncbi:MAG: hypothetical protein M1836_006991 [Candelina mexicana]|nr:MAG: hypothetical protein M1836_006991 [Candelina mexicana]
MYTTTDSQTVNYHGEREFFPPLVDCAIAVFPFPSFFDQSDTSTWEDLRRSASAIAKQCQKGKSVGVGGYEIGLGEKRNTAIIIFRLPRPSGVDYSAVASLSDAAWHKLYIFFQAHHDNELMGLGPGPDEPASSSQAEMPTLTLSDIEADWGMPPATLPINPSIIESWNPDIEFWLYPPDETIASVPDQTCGVGYCLPDQGCSGLKGEAKGGCQCFRFSARIAMNIIFGILFKLENLQSADSFEHRSRLRYHLRDPPPPLHSPGTSLSTSLLIIDKTTLGGPPASFKIAPHGANYTPTYEKHSSLKTPQESTYHPWTTPIFGPELVPSYVRVAPHVPSGQVPDAVIYAPINEERKILALVTLPGIIRKVFTVFGIYMRIAYKERLSWEN